MHSIGEISKQFGIPISTIRYYDKMGLLPQMNRESGQRRFGPKETEALEVILCLKKSGLSIEDIAQFMKWCEEGPSTYAKRLHLFAERKKALRQEIEALEKTEALVDYKIWYYTTALQTGSEEEALKRMEEGTVPPDIQKAYDAGFEHISKNR